MGLLPCPALPAWARPMAVRLSTRLDEAPASALRLRTVRSTAMAMDLHTREFSRAGVHGLPQAIAIHWYSPRAQPLACETNLTARL